MVSINRIDHDHDDYEVSIDGKIVYNILNNYPWFLVSDHYTIYTYVKKDDQWYYRGELTIGGHVFVTHKPNEKVLDVYDKLIKKEEEIKNFTYNNILIQDLLIPDVMNYIKTMFKNDLY